MVKKLGEVLDQTVLSNLESPLEAFNEIELTDEEKIEALRLMRERKYYAMKTAAYAHKIRQPFKPVEMTPGQLFEKFKSQYTIDSDNDTIMRFLCDYFSGVKSQYDILKGICIFGGVGVGKTTIMEFFNHNKLQSFAVIPCRRIEQEYANTNNDDAGEPVIMRYSYMRDTAINGNAYGHTVLGYCFDDLGTETIPTKYYGKEKNIMADILLNRYDSRLPFNMTHVTTNLTAGEITKNYGTRVTDRMRQMFNFVEFDSRAKSRR